MKKLRTPIAAAFLLISIALNLAQNAEVLINYFSYNYINVLELIGLLALSISLFTKRRNNTTIVLLGLITLIEAISLIIEAISLIKYYYYTKYFNISTLLFSSLLFFLSYALLTIYALASFEQTIVKFNLSKVNGLLSRFYYIPAILYAAASLITFIPNTISTIESISSTYYYLHAAILQSYILKTLLPSLTRILLNCIALLSIGKWIKDPYTKEVAPENATNGTESEEHSEAYCSLGKHIVLCLFTCGIWFLIWTYRTTKYLNKAPNAAYYNPTNKLLLCIFVPFYQIYWFYKHGQRIDAMSKQKNLSNSDMATLCLILGIFIPIVACIIMQDKINTLCTTKTITEAKEAKVSTAEQLKALKELLDNGVITQEEFDAKKKQLLGL